MTTQQMIEVLEAYQSGKKIAMSVRDMDRYSEMLSPVWDFESYDYKIINEAPLQTPMTHRQLAELMSKGYGEWTHHPSNTGTVYTVYWYNGSNPDDPVALNEQGQTILIRPWGTDKWRSPIIQEYSAFFTATAGRSK